MGNEVRVFDYEVSFQIKSRAKAQIFENSGISRSKTRIFRTLSEQEFAPEKWLGSPPEAEPWASPGPAIAQLRELTC